MKKSGNIAQPKGAADKTKKKLTPAEQAKLEEELALRALKMAEDNKKYGIKIAIEELPLILTADFLDHAWSNDNPREYVYDYLTHQFEKVGILYQIKPEEQRMYANQILLDLIFVKKDLQIDGDKQVLLINLLFSNFTNKDRRFSIEYPPIREAPFENEEEEEQWVNQENNRKAKCPELEDSVEPDDYRSALRPADKVEDKNYTGDLADFKLKLGKLMKKYPPFFGDKDEITRFVTHAMNSYFANFNLFRYISVFDRSEENISMQVSVDEPTVVAPLVDAVQIGKLDDAKHLDSDIAKSEEAIKREQEEAMAEEARRQEEEQERKKQEEWMGLDDKTIAVIQERLAKTKDYMLKRIEGKKEEYAEKLAAAKVQIKKK